MHLSRSHFLKQLWGNPGVTSRHSTFEILSRSAIVECGDVTPGVPGVPQNHYRGSSLGYDPGLLSANPPGEWRLHSS